MRLSDWSSDVCSSDLVKDEVRDLIKMARDNGVGLNLGPPNHSSVYGRTGDYEGLTPLVEAVAEIGCLACLDHPLSSYTVDAIQKLTPDGVSAGLFVDSKSVGEGRSVS